MQSIVAFTRKVGTLTSVLARTLAELWFVGAILLSASACGHSENDKAKPDPGVGAAKKSEPASLFNVDLNDKESPTFLEPTSNGRVKIITDGTMKVKCEYAYRQGGTHIQAGVTTHDPVYTGDIWLSKGGKEKPTVKLNILNASTEIPATIPTGAFTATMLVPTRIEVKVGERVFVTALVAGKQAESINANQTLEERAKRYPWYFIIFATFERRENSHFISLVGSKPGADNERKQWRITYVGTSLKNAIDHGRNVAAKEYVQALAKAIKIDSKNGKVGVVDFGELMVSIPRADGSRNYSHGGTDLSFTVERQNVESETWELTAESRDRLKKLVGLR